MTYQCLVHSLVSVDIDKVLRKEVNLDCKTLSNPHGLQIGYNIPFGESLTINQLVDELKIEQEDAIGQECFDENYHKDYNLEEFNEEDDQRDLYL